MAKFHWIVAPWVVIKVVTRDEIIIVVIVRSSAERCVQKRDASCDKLRWRRIRIVVFIVKCSGRRNLDKFGFNLIGRSSEVNLWVSKIGRAHV